MDKQAIFDKVTTHLLTQKGKSKMHHFCAYRGTGGRKCAIGALILDKFYHRKIEQFDITNCSVKEAIENSLAYFLPGSLGFHLKSNSDISFLKHLQCIHDFWEPEDLRQALQNFAFKYNLKFNPPE